MFQVADVLRGCMVGSVHLTVSLCAGAAAATPQSTATAADPGCESHAVQQPAAAGSAGHETSPTPSAARPGCRQEAQTGSEDGGNSSGGGGGVSGLESPLWLRIHSAAGLTTPVVAGGCCCCAEDFSSCAALCSGLETCLLLWLPHAHMYGRAQRHSAGRLSALECADLADRTYGM